MSFVSYECIKPHNATPTQRINWLAIYKCIVIVSEATNLSGCFKLFH